jgi:hypothetical protein
MKENSRGSEFKYDIFDNYKNLCKYSNVPPPSIIIIIIIIIIIEVVLLYIVFLGAI